MKIKFRPHHFLCTLCFQGKGYSPAFITNYEKIVDQLQKKPSTKIRVVNYTDAICAPCPHRQGAHCATQEKITHLDQLHSFVLDIQPGDEFSWEEAKQRIATKLTLEKFHHICAGCSWKNLGICEQVLTTIAAGKNS